MQLLVYFVHAVDVQSCFWLPCLYVFFVLGMADPTCVIGDLGTSNRTGRDAESRGI